LDRRLDPRGSRRQQQGRTKEEAREMVLDALVGISALRASEREPLGEAIASESLDIVSA
jgi:hypothetical protein